MMGRTLSKDMCMVSQSHNSVLRPLQKIKGPFRYQLLRGCTFNVKLGLLVLMSGLLSYQFPRFSAVVQMQ